MGVDIQFQTVLCPRKAFSEPVELGATGTFLACIKDILPFLSGQRVLSIQSNSQQLS